MAADAAALARVIQDPEIFRWIDIDQPYTTERATSFVGCTADDWAGRRGAHFVIDVDGEFAGYLGVLAVEPDMTVVELMYWLGATSRGRGLTTEAVQLVIPWIVEDINPDRIELGMIAGNAASARVAIESGFVFDRAIPDAARLDGHPADEHVYAYVAERV